MFLRYLTNIRKDFPLIFIVPAFILGQIVGYIVIPQGQILTLAICFLLMIFSALLRQKYLLSLAFLSTGLLSSFVLAPALPEDFPEELTYYIEVVDRPRFYEPGALQFPAKILAAVNFTNEIVKVSGLKIWFKAIDLPWKNASHLTFGSRAFVRAEIIPVKPNSNPFDYNSRLFRKGFSGVGKIKFATTPVSQRVHPIEEYREKLYRNVTSSMGRTERVNLLFSMVLGTRDVLTKQTENDFKRTGLTHLLVASGYQVTLVYFFLKYIISFLLVRIPLTTNTFFVKCLSLSGSLIYILLSGVEPAAVRAGIAISVLIISHTIERRLVFLNIILVTLLFLHIWEPGAILDPGVELTFAALVGIYLGKGKKELTSSIKEFFEVSAYATGCSSILTYLWFGTISIIGFPLNILLAPIASLLSCQAGLVGLFLFASNVDPAGCFLQIVIDGLAVLRTLIAFSATIETHIATIEWIPPLFFICIVMIVLQRIRKKFLSYLFWNGIK